jgi:hypothetical protein
MTFLRIIRTTGSETVSLGITSYKTVLNKMIRRQGENPRKNKKAMSPS